ncbi:MAG: response regulator [Elusimicrobia bacterium]|nr:response regulator [Elusimicrobiota bacterium]
MTVQTEGAARPLVVVAEDDAAFAGVLDDRLRAAGLDVIVVGTAVAALQAVRVRRPALLVLDIQMPGFGTGPDALGVLRKDDAFRTLPVVVMTSLREQEALRMLPEGDPQLALVLKPLDWGLFSAAVKRVTGAGA